MFESEHFRRQVNLLTFTLSVTEWCENTNAIGIYSKMVKYGGTYTHKDIEFEFASAISSVFKLYLKNGFYDTNKYYEDTGVCYEVLCTNKEYILNDDIMQKRYINMSSKPEILNKIANIFNVDIVNLKNRDEKL